MPVYKLGRLMLIKDVKLWIFIYNCPS